MRRLFWTIGVGLAGFLVAGKGSGFHGSVIGVIWGACIGYGFGSIFDQTQATKRVIVYWGVTIALMGPLFGLMISAASFSYDFVVSEIIADGIGTVVGLLFGSLLGVIHLKRLRVHEHALAATRTSTTTPR